MNNRHGLYWIFSALLACVLFFGCGRKPGEKLYIQALTEWEAGNHVRARALLEKSIRRRTGSTENADAYNRLGLLLWEMGETESAVEAFNNSIRIDAGRYPVLCNLGVALSEQKDFEGAEQAFREAALMQPDDPRPLAYAGIAYVQNRKWEEAGRNLRRALARNPDNPKLQNALALTELQTQGASAALKRLQQTAQTHPGYAPALFNLGAIYRYNLKKPVQAKMWFTRYLDNSSGVDAFSAFARSQLQALSQPVETPSLSYTPPQTRNRQAAERAFQQAVTAHRAGKTKEAIAGYIRTIEADDTYERAFYNLGLAYYADGRMVLASEAFKKAIQLNPAYVEARYNLALVNHYHLGNTPQALRDLQTVLSQKPDYQPAVDLLDRIRK